MMENIEVGIYVGICVLVVMIVLKQFLPEFSI